MYLQSFQNLSPSIAASWDTLYLFTDCSSVDCRETKYGCCPDIKTPADGPAMAGCGGVFTVVEKVFSMHALRSQTQWFLIFD